jgi:hypothetical protein
MNEVPDKLPYDHDKFVDREEALKIVLHKARRISAGLPVERRVVIFHGQRGCGNWNVACMVRSPHIPLT